LKNFKEFSLCEYSENTLSWKEQRRFGKAESDIFVSKREGKKV
jgi:hypothetical protein